MIGNSKNNISYRVFKNIISYEQKIIVTKKSDDILIAGLFILLFITYERNHKNTKITKDVLFIKNKGIIDINE